MKVRQQNKLQFSLKNSSYNFLKNHKTFYTFWKHWLKMGQTSFFADKDRFKANPFCADVHIYFNAFQY